MLLYYDRKEAIDTMREWYYGYQFGVKSLYCLWNVIKYVQALCRNRKSIPENYWANTSSNDMVRLFIDKADQTTRNEIEQLVAGESIQKEIRPDLTYRELDSSIDNLWSVGE